MIPEDLGWRKITYQLESFVLSLCLEIEVMTLIVDDLPNPLDREPSGLMNIVVDSGQLFVLPAGCHYLCHPSDVSIPHQLV